MVTSESLVPLDLKDEVEAFLAVDDLASTHEFQSRGFGRLCFYTHQDSTIFL